MFRKKKKEKEQAQDIRLASQIDEEESFLSLMGRMARENKLAAASAILILVFILAAIFAPFLTRYSYSDMDLLHRLSPPSSGHLFGTDEGGRDILTRLLYGARTAGRRGSDPAEHGDRRPAGAGVRLCRGKD